MFWLASEDHDIGEANHTFGTKPDGEIGRVSFRAPGGRELRRLPVDAAVAASVARYFDHLLPAGDRPRARCAYELDGRRTFTGWVARSWMRLFEGTGLVVVEPALLRPAFGELFERALAERAAVAETLAAAARDLRGCGYQAPLDPATAGTPFHVGTDGTRVRVGDAGALLRRGAVDPTSLSTDAALRPIFADAVLPSLAHVVGAGEMAYHAMLKPLYALFRVAQPAVLPRRSLTFLTEDEAEALDRYAITAEEALTGGVRPGAATDRLLGDRDVAEFDRVAAQIRTAFQPLAGSVSAVDPGLARTWAAVPRPRPARLGPPASADRPRRARASRLLAGRPAPRSQPAPSARPPAGARVSRPPLPGALRRAVSGCLLDRRAGGGVYS